MKTIAAGALAALTLLTFAGCRAWAQARDVRIIIAAPEKVNRRDTFSFNVVMLDRNRNSRPADVVFKWKIQWVGTETPMNKGASGSTETTDVKGAPGKAMLKIFGYVAQETWGEIANHTFEVE